MKYKGEKCFFCNQEFNDDDDIVVCPECGTPYHRNCYKEAGNCINHQLHETGEFWKKTKEDEKLSQTETFDSTTENINDVDIDTSSENAAGENVFGGSMGQEFINFDLNKPFFGLDPDEDFEGVKMSEIFAFVKTNTIYYIPLFKKMKNMGSKISFNFTSFFFPYFYFANRKMWFMSLISVLVMLVLQIPSVLINLSDNVSSGFLDESLIEYAQSVLHNLLEFIENNYNTIETFAVVCNMGLYIFRIAMCLLGNWLYYRFTIKSINKIKLRFPDPSVNMGVISNSGGTSALNVIFVMLIIFVGYFVMSMLIDIISILI